MFDANLRYLPVNQRFIAQLIGVNPDGALFAAGYRKGDWVAGRAGLLNENKNATVHIDTPAGRESLTVTDESVRFKDWLVFERYEPTAPERWPDDLPQPGIGSRR